jgi:hypothetical protein
VRRPLERERLGLDCDRRTLQLKRNPLGSNHTQATMDWKSFQRLRVRNAPAWGLDLLFIPAAILAVEWLWFVNSRPAFAIAAGALVVGARQLTHHFFPGRTPRAVD